MDDKSKENPHKVSYKVLLNHLEPPEWLWCILPLDLSAGGVNTILTKDIPSCDVEYIGLKSHIDD